ncbi:hypothetical protein [Mucilaginibacter antarcticus]|uniref:DoxX-like protein n=1 Tax=Mucilaginibacter antarcticus TaxID=1855725 RepID=A0ABW5XUV8_9SPHI
MKKIRNLSSAALLTLFTCFWINTVERDWINGIDSSQLKSLFQLLLLIRCLMAAIILLPEEIRAQDISGGFFAADFILVIGHYADNGWMDFPVILLIIQIILTAFYFANPTRTRSLSSYKIISRFITDQHFYRFRRPGDTTQTRWSFYYPLRKIKYYLLNVL